MTKKQLADLFEHATVTLTYWNSRTLGVSERDLTDKERAIIIKALRAPHISDVRQPEGKS